MTNVIRLAFGKPKTEPEQLKVEASAEVEAPAAPASFMDKRFEQLQEVAAAKFYAENPDGFFWGQQRERLEFAIWWRTAVAPLEDFVPDPNSNNFSWMDDPALAPLLDARRKNSTLRKELAAYKAADYSKEAHERLHAYAGGIELMLAGPALGVALEAPKIHRYFMKAGVYDYPQRLASYSRRIWMERDPEEPGPRGYSRIWLPVTPVVSEAPKTGRRRSSRKPK